MQEIDDYIADLRRDYNIGKLFDAQVRADGTPLRVLLEEVQHDSDQKLDQLLTLPKDSELFEQARVELLAMRYLEKKIVKVKTLGDEAHDELLDENQQANDEQGEEL